MRFKNTTFILLILFSPPLPLPKCSLFFLSLFFKSQLTNKSRPDPSDLEHGYMNYWNSASEEEAISKAGRKGNEEMKDRREEPSNSETCPAMKGFLTEGLGFISHRD